MKKTLPTLLVLVFLVGCAGRNVLITGPGKPEVLIQKKGRHIWIKPGTDGGEAEITLRQDIRKW